MNISPSGLDNLVKLYYELPNFDYYDAHFSVGMIIYWVGNFGNAQV